MFCSAVLTAVTMLSCGLAVASEVRQSLSPWDSSFNRLSLFQGDSALFCS